MSRMWTLAVGALLVFAIGAGLWWRMRPATTPPPAAPTAAASGPVLGLQLAIESAGAGDDAAATVRVFDVYAARRAGIAAAEKAAGRTWKGSNRAAVMAAPTVTPPDNWPALVTFTVTTASGASALAASAAVTAEPDAALFVIKARPGDRITATLPFGNDRITSNVSTIVNVADGRARTIAQGRVADVLGRTDALRAASQALLAANPASPWGDYFRGAALEAAGDRAAARAAYQRALVNSGEGYEPPQGLLLRIERLR